MSEQKFKLVSSYQPTGDQPEAIDSLVKGVENGNREQTLLGVTGSGKTFTMANVIAKVNRPTLVLAHNKTLAAQLCTEFREFFPENAVEYFVSYYDYYQPEAYIPGTDTYIEKDSAINDEIDKLRHSATSCPGGAAGRHHRCQRLLHLLTGQPHRLPQHGDFPAHGNGESSRDDLLRKLVDIQYERNDINFVRNKFRVRGDVVEIFPAGIGETAIRVEFFGDEIDRISEINASHRRSEKCHVPRGHLSGLPLHCCRRTR